MVRESRLVAFVVWAALGGCQPRPTAPSSATSGGPSRDLRAFAEFVEAAHPEPWRFVDRDELRRTVEVEARALDDIAAPSAFEVGRAFQRVIATLGDFHLQIALPAYQPDHPEPLSLVPLFVARVDDRILVDAASVDWPVGTELVRLAGRDAVALWDMLEAMVSVDGRRATVKRALVEADFAKYLHLELGMQPDYEVVVRRPDGTEETRILDGLTVDAYRALAPKRQTQRAFSLPSERGMPSLERRSDAVAWLRLPSFGGPDHEAYQRRVTELFGALDGVETLVVDVRGNPGGFRTHGTAVLGHLLTAPYRQWRGLTTRVGRIPRAHRAAVEPMLGDRTLREAFPGARGAGPWTYDGDPLEPELRPSEPHFAGEVVLFADHHTNSAASTFALGLLHHRPDVRFIGEELGGDCDRHVGNYPVLYRTASGVTATMSLMSVRHVEVDGCEPGRGLRPDVEVTRTLEDYVAGADPFWTAFDARR